MKKEEIIIQTANVKVRVIELLPGEVAPLHHHTEITDTMFGLSGEIVVRMKNPEGQVLLTPGARCTVDAGRVHQVGNNLEAETSAYLLVQGVGQYDFIKAPEERLP